MRKLLAFAAVLICAGVVSLAYYITVLLEKENRHSYFIEVSFDYGFFTLSAAGNFQSSVTKQVQIIK